MLYLTVFSLRLRECGWIKAQTRVTSHKSKDKFVNTQMKSKKCKWLTHVVMKWLIWKPLCEQVNPDRRQGAVSSTCYLRAVTPPRLLIWRGHLLLHNRLGIKCDANNVPSMVDFISSTSACCWRERRRNRSLKRQRRGPDLNSLRLVYLNKSLKNT